MSNKYARKTILPKSYPESIPAEIKELPLDNGEETDIYIHPHYGSPLVPSREIYPDPEQERAHRRAANLFLQQRVRRYVIRLSFFLLFLVLAGHFLFAWLAQQQATITLTTQKFDQKAVLSLSTNPSSPALPLALVRVQDVEEQEQISNLLTHQHRTQDATSAQGMLQFINGTTQSYHIEAGLQLPLNNGLTILVRGSGDLPPNQPPTEGTLMLPAEVLSPGSAGNISNGSLLLYCPCGTLPSGVRVLNATAFKGGGDTTQIPLVSADDVTAAHTNALPTLRRQAAQQAQAGAHLSNHEHWLGTPDCHEQTIQVQPDVGTPSAHFQLTLTFLCHLIAYNDRTIEKLAIQQFIQQEEQQLQPDTTHRTLERLVRSNIPQVKAPLQIEQATNGTITFRFLMEGQWYLEPSADQLQKVLPQICDRSPQEATNLLESIFDLQSVTITHVLGNGFFLSLPHTTQQIRVNFQ